ncbi:MAG: TRAP transporter small permease [Betaproteobacteria bacterium]|jgi:TRAP-type C4-dicarboxylate transport system permease small subunit|nr:TRAP transporter small permease [Betaproteobacteria bacterium]
MPEDANAESQAGAPSRGLPRALALAENAVLVVLLAMLVLVAGGQILLRQLDIAMTWSDPLARLLVLWIGVFGAVAASRENQHIAIDALSRFLPARLQLAAGALVGLFASGVCAVLTYEAARFVQFEYEGHTAALGGVPAWSLAVVLPLGFALIGIRYAIYFVTRVRALVAARTEA